jgi:hypothetical protein
MSSVLTVVANGFDMLGRDLGVNNISHCISFVRVLVEEE